MKSLSILHTAFESLQLNRFRSFLAMLGVVIGVAAVTAVVSIGEANRRRIAQEVERFGAQVFWLQRSFERFARHNPSSTRSISAREAVPEIGSLTSADLQSIRAFCPEIESAAPMKSLVTTATFRGIEQQVTCVATTSDYLPCRDVEILAGRFLHELDLLSRNFVCVLGFSEEVKKQLASGEILGEELWINNARFDIIGVVETKADLNFGMGGATIYLPHSLLPELGYEDNDFDMIYCRVARRSELEEAMRHSVNLLRSRRQGRELFEAMNARRLFAAAENLTRTATLVTAAIAGIALVVGGIGIMNIMLVAVTERTREIGLRKAVGARRRDIGAQFLLEAITLCFLGGQLGILLGVAASIVVSHRLEIPPVLSISSAVVGAVFSIVVGILAGFFPAFKAAQLTPIEALRYE